MTNKSQIPIFQTSNIRWLLMIGICLVYGDCFLRFHNSLGPKSDANMMRFQKIGTKLRKDLGWKCP